MKRSAVQFKYLSIEVAFLVRKYIARGRPGPAAGTSPLRTFGLSLSFAHCNTGLQQAALDSLALAFIFNSSTVSLIWAIFKSVISNLRAVESSDFVEICAECPKTKHLECSWNVFKNMERSERKQMHGKGLSPSLALPFPTLLGYFWSWQVLRLEYTALLLQYNFR